jgi:sugar O-acyltransferase (sialic acid O-acetyltransferase NeuD family)
MNKEFAIIGASGHAKVIIEIIKEAGGIVKEITDSNPAITELMGHAVTREMQSTAPVVVAVGNNRIRKRIVSETNNLFGKAIHPRANISTSVIVGEGTVVMAGATVNAEASIGKHCIINTNAAIDHECRIGDFVHISPGVSLAGNVTVDEGTHLGIGSSVIPGINIGKWVTIGAGASIVENIPDYAVVVGVPGKIIKFNHE